MAQELKSLLESKAIDMLRGLAQGCESLLERCQCGCIDASLLGCLAGVQCKQHVGIDRVVVEEVLEVRRPATA
jgi:hypothetical protein